MTDAPVSNAFRQMNLLDVAMRELRCTLERAEEVANKNAAAVSRNSEQIEKLAEALLNVNLMEGSHTSNPDNDSESKAARMNISVSHDERGESDCEDFDNIFASAGRHKDCSRVFKVPKQRDSIRNAFYVSTCKSCMRELILQGLRD